MEKLTIFTPSYNRAYILSQNYNALVHQSNKDFIWMIVDDGSTDNTKDLVDTFIKENLIHIVYIYQNNMGKYRAINTGIKNCKTELFVFLDSDDYFLNYTVDELLSLWEKVKNNSTIAGIVGRRCKKNLELIGNIDKLENKILNFSKFCSKSGFHGDTCRMYKTEILKEYLFPELEEKFVPENVMLGKIDEKYNVYFINKPLTVTEYLNDGYSKSFQKLLRANPYSYKLSLNQSIINEYNILKKCKKMIAYIEWTKIYKLKNSFRESNYKILYILMFPFSIFLMVLGIPKWFRNGDRNE